MSDRDFNPQRTHAMENKNTYGTPEEGCYLNQAKLSPDARLIAAAPDMLETLKWAEKCFTNYLYPQSAEEADYYLKDAENALDAISAAIAKATGRSA